MNLMDFFCESVQCNSFETLKDQSENTIACLERNWNVGLGGIPTMKSHFISLKGDLDSAANASFILLLFFHGRQKNHFFLQTNMIKYNPASIILCSQQRIENK